MAWKKALFLGGAVLLLAACSDATAPSTLRNGVPTAAAKTGATKSLILDASTVTDPTTTTTTTLDDCRSGYYVRSGDKDICVVLELQ